LLFYHFTLAAAALISASCAGFVYAQSPSRRATQLLALLMLAAAHWSGCVLGWNLAGDEAEALYWMRLAAPGWILLAAVLPHIVFHSLDQSAGVSFRPWRKLQSRVVVSQYAICAVLSVGIVAGFVEVGEPVRQPWGWTLLPTPPVYVVYGLVNVGIGVSCLAMSRVESRTSVAEALQLPWVWLGIGFPCAVILVTDILCPTLGIAIPSLGAASLALTGLLVVWTVLHYGLSMFTPSGFGDEIVESLADGVAHVNHDGSIRRANGALVRLSGYPADELLGMSIETLVDRDFSGPSELDDLRRELNHASGARIPVAVSLAVLHERQQNELGTVVVLRDLRELEQLRRSSLTHARLAAVGELAAGLAHEINNPIAFVGSNLRLLEDHWRRVAAGEAEELSAMERDRLVAEGCELIAESIEGVERAASIVRGVKNFTHAGSVERTPARLEDLLEDCLRMARPQLVPGVSIDRSFCEMPELLCSPQELKQVFLNLIVNAIHAVRGSGSIRVATELEGDLAVISVSDDGCGIAPEVIDRIFDPFFTTKPVGEGTGLGLGIAHQVVTHHGGVITVNSEPGSGSIFRVHLPHRPRADATS
jgi:PAS domain S-box-containing protein